MTKKIKALFLLMLLNAGCLASSPTDEPETQNAAPLYKIIWDASKRDYLDSRGLYLETQTLGEPDWTPGPIVTSELADPGRMARIEAAVVPSHCDFDFDYSLGPNLLLPHHSKVTGSAKLLLADAQIKITAHDFDRAVIRITQAMRIAHHTNNQEFLLAARARIEIVGTAAKIVLLAPEDAWSDEQSALLLRLFDEFTGEDPFGLRATALLEGAHFADWVTQCDEDAEGQDQFFDVADSVVSLGGDMVAPNRLTYVGLILLHGGLKPCADGYLRAVRDQVKAIDADDREAVFAEFMDRVGPPNLEYGPIATAFLPSLTWLLDWEDKAVEQIARVRSVLEGVEK